MTSSSIHLSPLLLLLALLSPSLCTAANNKLFAEYIGAEYNSVTFSNVPINPNVDFRFILAFAIDYTTSSPPSPTNGHFNIFWNSNILSRAQVSSFKRSHKVSFSVSLGGDSVQNQKAKFSPSSISTWVDNAFSSLTKIIKEYDLDGIDIDYEHFNSDINAFVECIGRLLIKLKNNKVIQFASIAPFERVEKYYVPLYQKYGNHIDYVNFQFYAYEAGTSVSEFLSHYKEQSSKYPGGKVLVSFTTGDDGGGLQPGKGFFSACETLKKEDKLHGIFVYSADNTLKKNNGFRYEIHAQRLLASAG